MVTVKLLVEGGNMKPGPTVAQQLGPIGINIGNVISDVNEKTKGFNGMNVPIILEIDSKTKNYEIIVKSPPTSELLKKEASISKASGARLKTIVGNIAFERVIFVSIQKHDNMLSNDLLDSIKSVLGTCQAIGLLVDNKEIKEVLIDLSEGIYDAMIKAKKINVDEEKSNKLKSYFDNINKRQMSESAAAAAVEESKKSKSEAKSGSVSKANVVKTTSPKKK